MRRDKKGKSFKERFDAMKKLFRELLDIEQLMQGKIQSDDWDKR
jgi:hypothetical protein